MMLDQLNISTERDKPWFISHTKINFRWIIDLNVKGKTIKRLEGDIGEYLHDLDPYLNI